MLSRENFGINLGVIFFFLLDILYFIIRVKKIHYNPILYTCLYMFGIEVTCLHIKKNFKCKPYISYKHFCHFFFVPASA